MNFIRLGKNQTMVVLGCLITAVIIFASLQAPAIKRQLDNWKLLPQPERLTELYFENHTSLPKTYSVGTVQSFKFTVHNLEYRTEQYSYQIIQRSADGQQSQILSSGTFNLAHGKSRTTSSDVTTVDLGPRDQIITTIHTPENINESIDYLITKVGV